MAGDVVVPAAGPGEITGGGRLGVASDGSVATGGLWHAFAAGLYDRGFHPEFRNAGATPPPCLEQT
jgi:hypothetical protein